MLIWDCVNFLKNYKNFLHFMLDKRTILLYSNTGVEKHNAAVAQSVERRIGSAEVTGPIPVSSSIKSAPEPWFYRVPAFSFPTYDLKTVLFSHIPEPAPIPVHKVN